MLQANIFEIKQDTKFLINFIIVCNIEYKKINSDRQEESNKLERGTREESSRKK